MSNFIIPRNDLIPRYENIKIGENNACKISVKGARYSMEDTSIMSELNIPDHYIFAVFDGHGGSDVSNFLKANFLSLFKSHKLWKEYTEGKNFSNVSWSLLFTELFLEIDSEIYKHDTYNSGSTAVVVLITPELYICANVGDSEAGIISNVDIKLSTTHRPDSPNEEKRIVNAGSRVINGRIDKKINMSRAFGDFQFKKMHITSLNKQNYALIASPSVNILSRSIDDKYLILASDGFWDFIDDDPNKILITSEEDILLQRIEDKKKELEQKWLQQQEIKDYGIINGIYLNIVPEECGIPIYKMPNFDSFDIKPFNNDSELLKWQTSKLIDYAISKGSRDNITVILVKL